MRAIRRKVIRKMRRSVCVYIAKKQVIYKRIWEGVRSVK